MNPITIASTFSIQKISKHHYLIRGDKGVSEYMNFCDVKWSDSYQGWIVHEDDEVDLIQMHMEVLDTAKKQRNTVVKKGKDAKKTKPVEKKKTTKVVEKVEKEQKGKKGKKMSDYEKIKKNIDVSDEEDDDEDDEDYIPSSDCYSEEDEEDDSEYETEEEEESEESVEDEESEEEEESESEEEEEPVQLKKEYQFYKKGILVFGKMAKKEQTKLDAIWNKHLKGWIVRKSTEDMLKKMGWKEMGEEKPVNIIIPRSKKTGTPVVSPVNKVETTYEFYKNVILVSGKLTSEQETALDAIHNPALNAYIVTKNYLSKLVDMGFREQCKEGKEGKEGKEDKEGKKEKEPELVKVDFSETKKLELEKTIE